MKINIILFFLFITLTACHKPEPLLSAKQQQTAAKKKLTCDDKNNPNLSIDELQEVNAACLRVGLNKNPVKSSKLWQF
jgi:hypothetical protein